MIKIYQNYEPLPGYRVLEKIGSGGFGEVWKCSVPGGLLKAIKFVSGKLGEKSDIRAEQEWRAIDRIKIIRHPFILTMERIDIIENCVVIVMELADKNLWDRYQECRQNKLPGIPKNEALHYLAESAEALDVINSQYQLQHLDIKPQNLFLVHNHLKIGDFGLVHDLTIADQDFQGGITPIYSAPELIEGRPSRFSDQYSLAIVYQEMTTGRKPFESENLRKLIKSHLNEEPDLSSLDENERPIVARALLKKPEERYKTCTDFINALKAIHFPKVSQWVEQDIILPDIAINIETKNKDQQIENQDLTKTLSFKKTGDAPLSFSRANKGNEPILNSENRPGSLIIGIGRTGIGATSFFGTTLENHVHSTGVNLPVKILGIDMDRQGISTDKDNNQLKLTSDDAIIFNLNRPNYYLGNKEKSEKLGQWLPLSKLYQIPKSLCTEGNRMLGKLALLDAPEKLFEKITQLLKQINQIAYSNTMPGKISPKIWILSHAAGGAAGSLPDVCKTIIESCVQLELKPPTINLVLVLPAKENCNIQMATNTAMLIQELEDKDIANRTEKIILIETPSNDKNINLKLLQDIGIIAYVNQLKIYNQGSEINKNFKPETLQEKSFKTAGAQLDILSDDLNQKLSTNNACLELLRSWVNKKPVYDQEINNWLNQEFTKNNIRIENITASLSEALEIKLGLPVDSFILKDLLDPLFKLENNSKTKEITTSTISKTTLEILKNSERQLGYNWYSDEKSMDKGSFFQTMFQKSRQLTEDFSSLIDSWVVQWIEKPGFRFAAAETILTTIKKKLEEIQNQINLNQEKFISNLKVDLLRLNNSIQKPSDTKSGYNQSIQKIIGQLKSLFRTQVEILQCDCIFSFLNSINLQINDHAKELAICKAKIFEIGTRITGDQETTNKKLIELPVFPIEKVLTDTELCLLDELIQEKTVEGFEAFTRIFIGSDNLLLEFEKVIHSSIATYLKNLGKLINGNILESLKDSSSKTNFIKSHMASVQHNNLLHSNTAPNQAIISFPRSVLGEWNSLQMTGPENQSIYLVPGNDDFISFVCEENIDDPNKSLVLNHFFEIQRQSQLKNP